MEWFIRGTRIPSEMLELAMIIVVFLGCLAAVYFIQRWMSGDEYYR